MRILLTNDDGYGSEGIETLASVLSDEHEVWVVAPATNKSGASSSINIQKKLRLERRGVNRYALEGTPADCVLSALKGGYLPGLPDVVLSGINRDENMGTDIVYSGTCAAARQACLGGVPSVALSTKHGEREDGEFFFIYESLAVFVKRNLSGLISLCGAREAETGNFPYFPNINAPSRSVFKGVSFASLCKRLYHDRVNIETENDETVYSTCVGGDAVPSHGSGADDATLVEKGYVAISVLYAEPKADLSFCNQDASQFVF